MQLALPLVTSKRCIKCGETKSIAAFHRDPKNKDGRTNRCAACACAKARAWTVANSERAAENKRLARERRPEHYAELRRTKYHADPVAAKAAVRTWVLANPERVRANKLRWAAANRAYAKMKKAERRAREVGAPGRLTARDVRAVFEYHGHRCAYCLRDDVKLTVDHVTALADGGSNYPDNVVPACVSCNSRKSDRGVLYMLNRCESARR